MLCGGDATLAPPEGLRAYLKEESAAKSYTSVSYQRAGWLGNGAGGARARPQCGASSCGAPSADGSGEPTDASCAEVIDAELPNSEMVDTELTPSWHRTTKFCSAHGV